MFEKQYLEAQERVLFFIQIDHIMDKKGHYLEKIDLHNDKSEKMKKEKEEYQKNIIDFKARKQVLQDHINAREREVIHLLILISRSQKSTKRSNEFPKVTFQSYQNPSKIQKNKKENYFTK